MYVQGEVLVRLNQNLFKFPLEVYGAFISIEDESYTIKIDSVHLLSGRSYIEEGDIVSYEELVENSPKLILNISMDFDKEFITELKNIDAYYIARIIKSFAPADTLPHYVNTRRGIKLVQSRNWNKSLIIKYNSIEDAKQVTDYFSKLECVKHSNVNEMIVEDHSEKPEIIYKAYPVIPDSLKSERSTVVVYVVVDTIGQVSKAGLFSCRDSIFIEYAIEAAYKCKFKPGKSNGKLKPHKTLIKYDF